MRLIDTNVFSYFFGRHSLADEYRALTSGHQLAVSFMTVAEALRGAILRSWGRGRMSKLHAALDDYLVIHSTPLICYHWADVRVQRKQKPIAEADAWVAASALAYDLELVTHNARDFEGITDLRVLTARM